MTTLTGHCLCGSSYRITMLTQDAAHAAQLWWQVHTGPGHGPATPAQCRAARLRAQQSSKDNTAWPPDVSSAQPSP